MRTKAKKLRGLVSVVGAALVGLAVAQELRKPAGRRTWHGQLWGRIPYEFRPPTPQRLRSAYWAPEDSHLFTPTPKAVGVNRCVNLARLAQGCSATCIGTVKHGANAAEPEGRGVPA